MFLCLHQQIQTTLIETDSQIRACFNLLDLVHEHLNAPVSPVCKRWKIMMMGFPSSPSVFCLPDTVSSIKGVTPLKVPSLFLFALMLGAIEGTNVS